MKVFLALLLLSTVFFDYHMRHDYLVEVSSLRVEAEERRVCSWGLMRVSALLARGADEEADEEAWK